MPVPPVTTLPRLFGQVKMSSLLTLNGFDRAILYFLGACVQVATLAKEYGIEMPNPEDVG
jgi:hypothetical protein